MATDDKAVMNAPVLSPDQLLTTTRTVRKRLDSDRPVARELIEECIEIAIQAPTGSFRQSWRWIVVGDPDVKKQIGETYRQSWSSTPKPAYDESDQREKDLGESWTRRPTSPRTFIVHHGSSFHARSAGSRV